MHIRNNRGEFPLFRSHARRRRPGADCAAAAVVMVRCAGFSHLAETDLDDHQRGSSGFARPRSLCAWHHRRLANLTNALSRRERKEPTATCPQRAARNA